MPLLSRRAAAAEGGGTDCAGPQGPEGVPAVPVDRVGSPVALVRGPGLVRTDYARRDSLPSTNSVARGLAGAVHERVNRIEQAGDWLGRWRDRIQGRPPRPIRVLDERTGESLAQWILTHVLYARKRPVPSFGFGLGPVLTHTVAARRQRRLRFALLTAVVVWAGISHVRGLAAIVLGVLLWQFVVGRLGRATLRWAFSGLLPAVLLAVVLFTVWSVIRPWLAVIRTAALDGLVLVPILLAAVSSVYLLDRWACHAYVQSLRPARERIGERPLLAPFAAKRVAGVTVAEQWQSIAYRKESRVDRFVGAGLDSWARGATRIQLTAAGEGEDEERDPRAPADVTGDVSVKFEADELLDKVRDELERLCGDLVATHALPNCDVAEFLGVPEGRWKDLRRNSEGGEKGEWPEAIEMCTEARDAPTGHFSRRYLAAQVVAWDGQIVVTVFAHAALEGNTLHFVTRPHVLAPLLPAANMVPAKGWSLARKLAETPFHACGDTAALSAHIYTAIGRGLGLLAAVPTVAMAFRQRDDGLPVSVREYCSHVMTEDMHQREDVQRYVSILQARMFSTVSAFLADHGLATGEFKRQAIAITQNFISGDNNQVNTGILGGGMQQGHAPDGPANHTEKAG